MVEITPKLGLLLSRYNDEEHLELNRNYWLLDTASGTVSGAHQAMGADGVIDTGPDIVPVENQGTPSTVLTMKENSTTSAGVNGMYVEIDWAPVGAVPNFSAPYAGFFDMEFNADNATGTTNPFPTALIAQINNNSTIDGGSTISLTGYSGNVNNFGGSISDIYGIIQSDENSGPGDMTGEYQGIQQGYTQSGPGTTNFGLGIIAQVGAFGGHINKYYQLVAWHPYMGAGTIGELVGLYLGEQGFTANVIKAYQIYSEGVSPSFFAGPVAVARLDASVVYSAAGTPLPAATTTLKGTRAVVSDATSPTFLGAYVSGGAVVAPVLCNGAGWVTA